jgi:hypothetical protein
VSSRVLAEILRLSSGSLHSHLIACLSLRVNPSMDQSDQSGQEGECSVSGRVLEGQGPSETGVMDRDADRGRQDVPSRGRHDYAVTSKRCSLVKAAEPF